MYLRGMPFDQQPLYQYNYRRIIRASDSDRKKEVGGKQDFLAR